MQHSHISELDSEGHHALWQALKYPLLAVIVLLAVDVFNVGVLITISIFAGLVYALVERVKKVGGQLDNRLFHARLIGDGGCFPNDRPETKKPYSPPSSVLDGGSFERNRI
jgi:hypothetical protein